MNKKQVHTPTEGVPTTATGTTSGKTVSQRQTSGTQASTTRPATPVGSDDQEQVQTESIPDNVISISHARNRHARQESAPDRSGGQLCQNGMERKIDHLEAQIEGTGGTGTDLAKSGAKQVRKQGQRGKDKQVRKKRTDSNQLAFPADDRARILAHNLNVMKLGRIKNRDDLDEVQDRISFYIDSCIQHEVLPTVAGLALCLGIDRATLWDWVDGKRGTIKNRAVVDTLKSVYMQINCQYEDLLTQGKITPVAGFFLMQNNFGYKNTTDHVVSVQQAEEPNTDDLAARAGLLDADTGAD